MKALALTVWDKKIFENFLLYLYVKSQNPQHRTNFPIQGHNLKYFGRASLDDATYDKYECSSPYRLGQEDF